MGHSHHNHHCKGLATKNLVACFSNLFFATHPLGAFHATRHGTQQAPQQHQEHQLLPPAHPLIHLPPSPFPSRFLHLLLPTPPPSRPSPAGEAAFRGVEAQGESHIDKRGAANRIPDLGVGGRRGEFEEDAEGSVPSMEPLRGALGPGGLGKGEVGAREFRDQRASLCEIRKCENGG
ncbi:hypothetical protein V8G54_008807 [Vigna mungo]|uniref:Uncharacterized protein n=1 Tax=Vigna mungo TaxID=3915 RepID=A0AAQ3P4M9_VIGMU